MFPRLKLVGQYQNKGFARIPSSFKFQRGIQQIDPAARASNTSSQAAASSSHADGQRDGFGYPPSNRLTTPSSFNGLIRVNDFQRVVKEHQINLALKSYKALQSSQRLNELSSNDFNDYLMLLCRYKPSSSFALPNNMLINIIDSVVNDMKSSNFNFRSDIYPVLLRFFVSFGQYEKAVKLFKDMEINQLESSSVESLVSMLVCFQKLGDFSEAERVFHMARKHYKHLEYGKFLAERTMIKVYAQAGKFNEAMMLRDELLSRPHIRDDLSTRKAISLSYLDACADSKNYAKFLGALEDMKVTHSTDVEFFNHVLINLSKLGKLNELSQYLEQHNVTFKPYPNSFAPTTKNYVEEYLEHILKFRSSVLAPSTFSDILFNLSKMVTPSAKDNQVILQCAEQVFSAYESQILDSFDRFKKIAHEMKRQSQIEILQNPSKPGNVLNVPYSRMYAIYMRGNSPFVAMAKLFVNMGMVDEALGVLERGYEYSAFAPAQLTHIFGDKLSDPLLEQNISKFTTPRKDNDISKTE